MIMTKDEIQASYRDAKNKTTQIGILADLNCCSKKEMRAYLRDQCGFEVFEPKGPSPEQLEKNREKMREAKKKKEYTDFTEEDMKKMKGDSVELPKIVQIAITEKMVNLQEQIDTMTEIIKRSEEEIARMRENISQREQQLQELAAFAKG